MKTDRSPAWIILPLVLAMAALGFWAAKPLGLLLTWGLVALLMLFALLVAGVSLGRGAAGVLIDPLTKTMSLSRLQVILWTWVILSAFITLATARVADAPTNAGGYQCPAPAEGQEAICADPLGIQLPPLLWALMGISLTSAVASPLLKAAKAQKTADQQSMNVSRALTRGRTADDAPTFDAVLQLRKGDPAYSGASFEGTKAIGAVVQRDSAAQAAFSDVLTGDEVATFGYVDIAKLQNLFFTIIAVASYTVALAGVMAAKDVASVFAFPDPTASLVAIVGISHGGYLADKAITHSVPEQKTQEI